MNGVFRVPQPSNEPVHAYRAGSPEKRSIKAKLAEMRSREIEIPLIIGGEEVRTGQLGTCVIPHEHGHILGRYHKAGKAEVERAIAAARVAHATWSRMPFVDRASVLLRAADLLSGPFRDELNVATMLGQSKTVFQAEIDSACELIDFWRFNPFYAQQIYEDQPMSSPGVWNRIEYRPLEGFVFAVTPFNFTSIAGNLPTSPALMGNTVLWKPASSAVYSAHHIMKVLMAAGLPPGVINLVFGVPSEVSEYLIPHPIIRKISFTGSTAVGKHLASLAGKYMKRVTMELGGHAPAIVFDDADIDSAVKILSANKFRNAGQVCIAPTRFLVQENVYRPFLEKFIAATKAVKVGDGLDKATRMGPLAHARRVEAMDAFVADAQAKGAKIETGGKHIGNKGFFFEPTVMTDVPLDAKIMNEEPFGPLAPITSFQSFDAVVEEANRLPYGLAAYAYTRSAKTAAAIGAAIETGMVSINHHGLALPEVPFGGVKDSGYGSEGGSEAIEGYLNTKFVTQAGL